MQVTFVLNGKSVEVETAPLRRLLDVLRCELALTGTKEGCGEGECGACTVLIDGSPVNACLVPVCQVDGAEVVTVEGVGDADALHPVQAALAAHGGAQCGICTPGFVVTGAWMVEQGLGGEDVDRALAGNICRCTGYGAIRRSLQAVLARPATAGESES